MRLEEYTEPVSEASSSDSFRLRLVFKTVMRLSSLVQKRTSGRAEAAGLLFGTASHGLINVSAFRSFALELPYEATLPLQQLRDAATAALAASRFDPEVATLQPVGWYRLHLEQCSELSEEEVELHNYIAPGTPFAALLLQPGTAGLLSGLVFVGSPDNQPLSLANQRRGSLNISTASSGVESVEITVRDSATSPEASNLESSWVVIRRRVREHGDAFRQSLNRYAWGLAAVAALLGFLVGATLPPDGQASTGNASVATAKPQAAPVSALSKTSVFDLAVKRGLAPNVVITWNNGLTKPTLAYATVIGHNGTANFNITASYRPNGVLVLPGQRGPVEASLALSDGLDNNRAACQPAG